MKDTRTAPAPLEPGAAAALAAAATWRLDSSPFAGARTLAAAAGTADPIRAAVNLAAALAERGPA